jgi:acetolactate synthase-1/2/3 large subunit
MQVLQKAAYRRTTATVLSKIDYASFARGLGVTHVELNSCADLEARIRGILCLPGPVLVNVVSDYGDREVRWIKAVRGRYTQELSTAQKVRFLARIGARTVAIRREND